MSEPQSIVEPRESIATLERVAAELGAHTIAEEAVALLERARAGLFFVACVGQFKRGKSTLLNGLLGETVLPIGVAPITAAVTILRHGPQREARVRFSDGRSETVSSDVIAAYVSEEETQRTQRVYAQSRFSCRARYSPMECALSILQESAPSSRATPRSRASSCHMSMPHSSC